MTSPTLEVAEPVRRFLAMMFRRNPRLTAALSTRARTAGRTFGSWLNTRDTVLRLTPARSATSCIVGLRSSLTGVRPLPFVVCDIVRRLWVEGTAPSMERHARFGLIAHPAGH